MRSAWHIANPGLLQQLEAGLGRKYPTLHIVVEEDVVFVRGSFPVVDDGRVLDRYQVELELPRDYPDAIPILREVGGRIAWAPSCHVNENGVACPFLPDERWRVYPRGSTLIDYLDGPMRSFFLGQSLVQIGQPWPFGERPHGASGALEYYVELLGTRDPRTILAYLSYLGKDSLKGHWDCPCGSGRRLRDCHFKKLIELRGKIPRTLAQQRHGEFERALNSQPTTP
jgi:hypothetical protein